MRSIVLDAGMSKQILTKDSLHVTSTVSIQHLIGIMICNTELSWRDSNIFAIFLVCSIDVEVPLSGACFLHQLFEK